MIRIPPCTVKLPRNGHTTFQRDVEFALAKGCIARMNIYAKEEEETVYVEFHPVPETFETMAVRTSLLYGACTISTYTLYPQLILS